MTRELHAGGRRIRKTIALIVARDGKRCGRCSRIVDVELSGSEPMGPSIGHIVPVRYGGSDAPSNLRLEHRSCNIAAGAGQAGPVGPLARPIPIE